MTYCIDTDLLKFRSNILSLGVDSWEEQREESYEIINRVISTRWYRRVSSEYGYDYNTMIFNPDLVRAGSLKRLECFKTLELAYMLLKKDSPEADGFERNEKAFRGRYNEELEIILATGLDYDWNASGAFTDSEVHIRMHRRLTRA